MTSETSRYPQAPPPPPAAPPAGPGRGWSGSDLAVGGALIVLLIALFLPWFSNATVDGPTAHGYLWIVFVLAVVALIVLVAREAITRLPGNLPSPEQMLVGATGLAFLLTFVGVVQKPSADSASGVISKVFSDAGSVGWSYGGFVAVLVALVAFIAALREAAAQRTGRPLTVPPLRRRGSSA